MSRYRNWVFTVNNYTESDIVRLSEVCVKYMVVGKEVGEKGTPHLQGYVELENPKGMSAVKKYLGVECHLEVRKGTAKEASDYCKKDGDYVEYGKMSNPNGVRKDYAEITEHIKNGGKIKDLLLEGELSLNSLLYAEKITKYLEIPRTWKTEVIWIYGPTGTGKSRYCFENYPEAYWKSPMNKWWDGYDGHEVVIIDDYRKDFCRFHELLKIFDRYPFQVEVKGVMRHLVAKTILVTCPQHYEDVWGGRTSEDMKQLSRRIDKVMEFKDKEETAQATLGNTKPGCADE